MDFTKPEVIRKHNRTRRILIVLAVLWMFLCIFPANWVMAHYPWIQEKYPFNPHKVVFGIFAVVLPLVVIILVSVVRWLISAISNRASA